METEDESSDRKNESNHECCKSWKQTAARAAAHQEARYRHKEDPAAQNRRGDRNSNGN
jgi:hypothetical protein